MPDSALALLQAHGYAVRFRTHEWVECLVTRDEEAWVGQGPDRAAALEMAVAQACPSALAQALFRRALAEQQGSRPERTTRPPPSAPRYTSQRAPVRSAVPLVPRAPLPAYSVTDAIEELAVLKERIKASREELGLCSPERQRLAILAWICEARAHTDRFGDEPKVRDGVASISRLLTDIGKAFWPGSVTALQLQMRPRELPRHMLGAPAETWTRAAELAEAALQAVVLRDDADGLDAYGWADSVELWPRAMDPTERLRALIHDVEHLGGRIEKHAAARPGSGKPDPGTYQRWVRTLRWLRTSGVDPDRWARLAGRLRWWGGRRDGTLQAGLRELEPHHRPSGPWSEVLGERHEADTHHGPEAGLPLPAGLVERVRHGTQGKRLVWVGPRRDPVLLSWLEQTLSDAELEWRISEQSRLQDLGSDIESGRFDLVLGALGLQNKAPDLVLARACKKRGVGYVRVFRGESWSCLRGIDRALAG